MARRLLRQGRQATIRPSRRDGQKSAGSIALRIQDLADLSYAGLSPGADLTAWLGKIGKDLAGKLAAAGLVANRENPQPKPAAPALAALLDAYISGRSDVKDNTLTNFTQARKYLVEHFGAERALDSITAGDADQWRIWLKGRGLSDNTIRRHCGRQAVLPRGGAQAAHG